ncbi:MAG: bacteriophage Gp15 family protein [Clostridia bacterium]|nr:bacteriophage Gp15 family protein [Clostridia bacterium]
MSILTENLPDSLTICGVDCPIRTDFKTWIKVSGLLGKDVSAEMLSQLLGLVFEKLPPNLIEAMKTIFEFYRLGEEDKRAGNKKAPSKSTFDFDYDGNLIFAAFLQQYNVDLCESNMHWWKFRALFDCLSDDTQFMKVVGYRSMDISKIKDKKQKSFYRKMKERYRLPDKRSESQKELDFTQSMSSLFGG